nr:hypothetical protein [Desulfobacula sp.]
MKLGFPVFDQDTSKVHAVWLRTTAAMAEACLFFNGRKLPDAQTALAGTVGLGRPVQSILDQGYDVHMDATIDTDDSGEVLFCGDSWKLCMHLMEKFCDPLGPDSSDILISCDIQNQKIQPWRHQKPSPRQNMLKGDTMS